MSWLIERAISNLDLITGVGELLSGMRRIIFASLLGSSLVVCSGCTYTVKESQDAIGASTRSYALSWGDTTSEEAPKPRRSSAAERRYARRLNGS